MKLYFSLDVVNHQYCNANHNECNDDDGDVDAVQDKCNSQETEK